MVYYTHTAKHIKQDFMLLPGERGMLKDIDLNEQPDLPIKEHESIVLWTLWVQEHFLV